MFLLCKSLSSLRISKKNRGGINVNFNEKHIISRQKSKSKSGMLYIYSSGSVPQYGLCT